MSNLPGFDVADFVISTWARALGANLKVMNDAWNDVESGNFEFKNWAASWAKCYRNQFDALREIATFDVRTVEWQQKTLRKGLIERFSFKTPVGLRKDSVQVAKMDRIGGEERGSIEIMDYDIDRGALTIRVMANDDVQVGDQWIGFAYDRVNGGPPLGVILAIIGN
jgi:hypothetical protein